MKFAEEMKNLQKKIDAQMIKPIVDKHNEIKEKENQTISEEEIMEQFKDYGKPKIELDLTRYDLLPF
jgi:hypothetical protein